MPDDIRKQLEQDVMDIIDCLAVNNKSDHSIHLPLSENNYYNISFSTVEKKISGSSS